MKEIQCIGHAGSWVFEMETSLIHEVANFICLNYKSDHTQTRLKTLGFLLPLGKH